jgi:hypothetical protein
MLRGLRAPPKTDRSAAPGQRLEDLARALEETESRIAATETPEQARRRRADALLGFPLRAASNLRRLARHWDARVAGGLIAPSIGRLRKGASVTLRRDQEKKMRALGRWLRENGLTKCVRPEVSLTSEMVSNLACAHTTCSCAVCLEGDPTRQTCETVAVCRAAVELYEVLVTAPASPLGHHLRVVVGTVDALWDVIDQVLTAAPELEEQVARLQESPEEIVRMLQEPEIAPAAGLELSVLMLRVIANGLLAHLADRCGFNNVPLRNVGAAGPGAPSQRRAPEQHLAAGSLRFVRRGRSLAVERLRKRPRERPEMAKQRTRFIRAKATG